MEIAGIICLAVYFIVNRICTNDERVKKLQLALDADKLQLEREKIEHKQLSSRSSY